MKKIDLLDVKIWNRKKERWFQVKPESLLLFEENIGKCWRCKFHVKHCQCKEKITFKQRIANFKEKIKMWVRNTSTKYHK